MEDQTAMFAPLLPAELRTLSALLETMFPAGPHNPGAIETGALAYVMQTLDGRYSADLPVYKAALTALDAAAAGFADADDAVRCDVITRFERGDLPGLIEDRPGESFTLVLRHLREGLFGDPQHGGNTDFRGWSMLGFPGAQSGYPATDQAVDAAVDRAPASRAALPADDLPDLSGTSGFQAVASDAPCDVLIIGGGAVGGFLAHKLVKGGLRVTILEAGPARTGRERRMDEIASTAFRNEGGAAKFNQEIPTWRRNDGERALRATRSQGLETALGGNSVAWGAVTMRFYEHDFQTRSATQARYGEGAIPANSSLIDWPFTYADLEPFYAEAEDLLGVSGRAWDPARPDNGGNRFEAPRKGGYAMPPLRTSGLGRLFADAASAEGYHPFPLPAAITTEPFRGRAACTYCSFCSRFGCHVDAKASVQNTVLADALATGLLTIVTGARVVEIVTDDAGAATGARYVASDGAERIATGRTVVLATYTFENVRLLLRSTSARHPGGIGNDAGQVGLHYMTRQQPAVFGVFDQHELNRFIGPTAQAMAIADLSSDHFDHADLDFIRGGRIAAFNQYLPAEASAVLPPDVPRWGKEWRDFLLHAYRRTAMLFIDPEILPYASNKLDLDPDHVDPWGFPVTRITFDIHDNERRMIGYLQERAERILARMGATRTWKRDPLTGPISTHDVGGTRMGDDPQNSVVDGFGRVHDTPNLVVLGGSTFVSLPAVNPLLTILAIALRAGDKILEGAR